MTGQGGRRGRPLPSEYDVAFAVKEWLLGHGWSVVAFNPPGHWGTFSIPFPSRDPRGRGRAATRAPDIIAVKGDCLLLAECRGHGRSRVLSDVERLSGLISNKDRMRLLYRMLQKVCAANDVQFPAGPRPLAAVCYGGSPMAAEARKKYAESPGLPQGAASDGLQNFFVEVTDPARNTASMDASVDPLDGIKTTLYSAGPGIEGILLRGPSK